MIGIMITGLTNNVQSQVIRGQLIGKYQDKYESLPGISVMIDTAYQISDIDGFFNYQTGKNYPKSLVISGYVHPRLLIYNLPVNYDTLDLGKIELIEHMIISPHQYDSIRNNVISSFKNIDILIVQQQKADNLLKTKYSPLNDWSSIVGYVVLDKIMANEMLNPLDEKAKIKIDYNVENDLISLDYNKIKK
jgi:hypothetical protein